MANSLSASERAVLEEQLVPAFRSILGEAPIPADPAELELLAATLLVPLELPEMPAAVTRAFFDEIEGRGGEDAAGVLAALAALATGDAAVAARAGVERLRLAGVSSPAAGRVGTATVREAGRLDGDGAELLVALLGRPKARRLPVAMLGIETEDTGGALVECMLSPPMPVPRSRRKKRSRPGPRICPVRVRRADGPVDQVDARDCGMLFEHPRVNDRGQQHSDALWRLRPKDDLHRRSLPHAPDGPSRRPPGSRGARAGPPAGSRPAARAPGFRRRSIHPADCHPTSR
jgi:hypothetical protein